MKKTFLTVVLFSLPSTLLADRDPIGEQIEYTVERNLNRTSTMIRGGTLKASVVPPPSADQPDHYGVKIDYAFDIFLQGKQIGSELLIVPEQVFTQEFIEMMRRVGFFEGETFKVRHMGVATVRNMDRRIYEDCDKLHFYDFKEAGSLFLGLGRALYRSWLQFGKNLYPFDRQGGDMEDLEFLAHVQYGFPVIGGVKIDLKGRYKGNPFKVGGDYLP